MWLPDAVTLGVQRNASVPVGFRLVDQLDNTPVNLTGASIRLAASLTAGTGASVIVNGTIDDPLDGGFALTLDGSAFASIGSSQETIVMAYDIRLTAIDGTSIIVMRGPLFVQPGVN